MRVGHTWVLSDDEERDRGGHEDLEEGGELHFERPSGGKAV